jgi:hypothetical protein
MRLVHTEQSRRRFGRCEAFRVRCFALVLLSMHSRSCCGCCEWFTVTKGQALCVCTMCFVRPSSTIQHVCHHVEWNPRMLVPAHDGIKCLEYCLSLGFFGWKKRVNSNGAMLWWCASLYIANKSQSLCLVLLYTFRLELRLQNRHW